MEGSHQNRTKVTADEQAPLGGLALPPKPTLGQYLSLWMPASQILAIRTAVCQSAERRALLGWSPLSSPEPWGVGRPRYVPESQPLDWTGGTMRAGPHLPPSPLPHRRWPSVGLGNL